MLRHIPQGYAHRPSGAPTTTLPALCGPLRLNRAEQAGATRGHDRRPNPLRDHTFRHEALLYAGDADFLTGTSAFVRDGVKAGEPTLVVVNTHKIDLLRAVLGDDSDAVSFADMAEVGGNPARIIPVWQAFLDEHADSNRQVRGIGEPVTPERSAAELAECQRHESMLNLAFDAGRGFLLLCPYDTTALEPAVVEEACRSHPFLRQGTVYERSVEYRGAGEPLAPDDQRLPEPSSTPAQLTLGPGSLSALREFVGRHAREAGASAERIDDLVLATNEVATNSLIYGGGYGSVRIWREDGMLVCEIRDNGHITQPLVGRRAPAVYSDGNRGLWMVNQLCDLTQLRSSDEGTVFRLHIACP